MLGLQLSAWSTMLDKHQRLFTTVGAHAACDGFDQRPSTEAAESLELYVSLARSISNLLSSSCFHSHSVSLLASTLHHLSSSNCIEVKPEPFIIISSWPIRIRLWVANVAVAVGAFVCSQDRLVVQNPMAITGPEQRHTASGQARQRHRLSRVTLNSSLGDCETTSPSMLNIVENNISEPDVRGTNAGLQLIQTALSQHDFVVQAVSHRSNIARTTQVIIYSYKALSFEKLTELVFQNPPVVPIFVPARPPSPTSYHYGSIHLLSASTDRSRTPAVRTRII